MTEEELRADIRIDARAVVVCSHSNYERLVESVFQLMWANFELRRSNDTLIARINKLCGTQGAGGHPAQRE